MSVALSSEASISSCCSSRMTTGSSTSTVWGVNGAAAASWTAAMEARERERQVQRLAAACGDKQAKVDVLQQELKQLQQQLARQQRSADAALAAARAEALSSRTSLAGDLQGATTAMQEATRKLAASESQCSNLQQQLAAKQRLQQQLEFDVAYLRSRRAPVAPAGPAAARAAVGGGSAACTNSCDVGSCYGGGGEGVTRGVLGEETRTGGTEVARAAGLCADVDDGNDAGCCPKPCRCRVQPVAIVELL
ncbi:hypothetical protein COO60DRAFT_594238 [Scenedesmus sp. NREL 46B-D3]|nr:hypothetical protein COO60DRAFT_594238 [Scenedesmus sp. NREL 46B-D3]